VTGGKKRRGGRKRDSMGREGQGNRKQRAYFSIRGGGKRGENKVLFNRTHQPTQLKREKRKEGEARDSGREQRRVK